MIDTSGKWTIFLVLITCLLNAVPLTLNIYSAVYPETQTRYNQTQAMKNNETQAILEELVETFEQYERNISSTKDKCDSNLNEAAKQLAALRKRAARKQDVPEIQLIQNCTITLVEECNIRSLDGNDPFQFAQCYTAPSAEDTNLTAGINEEKQFFCSLRHKEGNFLMPISATLTNETVPVSCNCLGIYLPTPTNMEFIEVQCEMYMSSCQKYITY